MANYSTTAQVVVTVNGERAKKMLVELEREAQKLRDGMDKAAKAGDTITLQKLSRELRQTERNMRELQGTSKVVEHTLQHLNEAAPKELKKTLRELEKQLKGIERGSEAWDKQVEKIKQVRAELQSLNEEMQPDESLEEKVSRWFEAIGKSASAAFSVVSGIATTSRKFVDDYAAMEQEMANVRKFTGMTSEEVEALNEEFKKMDTRTSREELNKLAQEAGRLGKSSQEDVLGFVRAADQINVALDDLGDGATLTLSKLTGIFGDEKRLGTEKSLLAVGSVINELSQNCSASAPYLAEFASRVGGVGAQAGLTVQQIMGFGAVLDSNNQKVEAASTALQQVMVRVMTDPAKYAQVAGLEVSKFTELVKTDMNAAMIQLLEQLNSVGGMDKLSPMFKDMGETGSRAISALSTLAGHIDEVKAQQEAASKAFAEATSVTKEFDVQNNTVQAGLEKAEKSLHELCVTLGEELEPVAKWAISSSISAIELVKRTVAFVKDYRTTIVAATASVAAFTIALNAAIIKKNALLVLTKAATAAKATYTGTVNLLKAAFFVLTGQTTKAKAAMAGFNATMKANIFIAVASAIAMVVTALIDHNRKVKEAAAEQRRLREEQKRHEADMRDYSKKSAEYSQKELTALDALYKAATDETRSKEDRISATKQLQQLYPSYFSNLSTEAIMVGDARDKYDDLRLSIIKAADARAAMDKIQELGSEKIDDEAYIQRLKKANEQNQRELEKRRKIQKQETELLSSGRGNEIKMSRGGLLSENSEKMLLLQGMIKRNNARIEAAQARVDKVTAAQEELAEVAGSTLDKIVTTTTKTPTFTPQETEKERKQREAAEKRAALKEKQEFKAALNDDKAEWEAGSVINTAELTQGKKTWSEFLKEKRRLEVQYFEDRKATYKQFNLEEDEDYQELLKKEAEATAKWEQSKAARKVSDAKTDQKKAEADAQLDYYSPDSKLYNNEEALQQRLFTIRLNSLKEMQAAYADGSKEWHEYQIQIEEAESAEQLRRQEQYAQKVAEWRKQYEYLEAGERYKMESDLAEQAHKAGLLSEEEYQQTLADLKKKYADQYTPDSLKPSSGSQATRKNQLEKDLEQQKSLYEQGLIAKEEYERRKAKLESDYAKEGRAKARAVGNEYTNMLLDISDAWKAFFDKTGEDGGNWATKLADLAGGVFAMMNAGLETYMQYQQACADLEVAKTEKKYDALIKAAEENDEEVKRLEEERDAETAAIRKDAAEKSFALQVAQAIATTAMNAIAAYGSAQSMPYPASQILGALAAALATAQGVAQLAIIKKQKEVADTQGYAEGGFTPAGGKYEPAGTVHRGEWVASQKLVNNPRIRPLLEALDQAQRNNTIGSIRMEDVSRSVTAPMVLATQPAAAPTVVATPAPTVVVEQNSEYAATMKRLADRLNEPFVTVNTVTGDYGSKQSQDEYNKMIRNKNLKKYK
ncbi:MAG: phage tail tape measure protein [Bacteroides sp.]|nr:phage tail tape measure protein [Bacteroides sp.]MCM1380021.1 phage tail tape measure protein [Bacteroides sp.]MCM1446299.1 phage tail tape measure protein [Prevotella sp.]